MRHKLLSLFILVFLCFTSITMAQSSGSSQLQASNLLNPNISVIGWFQGEAGHRVLAPGEEDEPAFQLKEAEVAFQAVVDPYARADIFLSVTPDDVEIEEGTLTWFHLPGNLGLKVGKFKANMGKFNRVHTPETAFADRPLVHQAFFGDEGLNGTGGSLSWNIPNPLFYTSLDAEVITTPEGSDTTAFKEARKKDLTYVWRLGSYFDLTEATNLSFGLNGAQGAAGQEFDAIQNSSDTLDSLIYGFDMTFRWKNPRQAVYRSALWQTEVFWNDRDLTVNDTEHSYGLFSHIEYQFLQRWKTGARWDYTQSPVDKDAVEKGGLLYLTFYPSEFSLISLQGRRVRKANDDDETLGWLKITFNIGPHGSHAF